MNKKQKVLSVLMALLAFSLMASAANITTALASISGNYSIVWQYNSSAAQPWSSYEPADPAASDLSEIFPEYGYWVQMTANDTLEVTGTALSSTNIAIISGWNLAGYPSITQQNITTALASISGNYSIVWQYNSSAAQPWSSYEPADPAASDLGYLYPGFGYWILATSNDTLVI